ncbi:MAG: cysteine protease [Prevotella sp.]|nr:cysteine protease [Prevotella sp.]
MLLTQIPYRKKASSVAFGLLLGLTLLLTASCQESGEQGQLVDMQQPKTECMVKITPVKDQGRSDFCWIYAMLATIESEHLLVDDSVNLSAHFLARKLLEEQAERVYLSNGKQKIRTRGLAQDAIDLMMRGGLTHFDAFQADANYRVVARKVEQAARQAVAQRAGLSNMTKDVERLLDDAIHPAQKAVYWLGAEYAPLEFAHSVCMPDEYVALTSFSHHPFGTKFAIEVPDNVCAHDFKNVSLDSLMNMIDGALLTGHPVCWEGDTSEPGFSFEQGFAHLENEDQEVTQQTRQQLFDRLQTTDDHCMEIIGLARNTKGRRYYICKNSWGKDNPFGGLMYLSENYVRAKTLAVWMSWKAIQQ